MSINNDDHPSSSSQAKRNIVIGCLAGTLLVGGLYWFYAPPAVKPAAPAPNSTSQPTQLTEGATPAAVLQENAAQRLLEAERNSAKAEVRPSATLAKAVPAERVATRRSSKSAADNAEPTETPATSVAEPIAAPAPVEKPAAVVAANVVVAKPEASVPKTTAVLASETKSTTTKPKATVLKSANQPALTPTTASDAPIRKRKTKNDEDVDVDFR